MRGKKHGKTRQTNAESVVAGVSHAESERDEGAPLEPVLRTQESGDSCAVISYRRFAVRPLDAENFAGSTKALTDALVEAFREDIADDSPEYLELQHSQTRVGSKDEEGTWVKVFVPWEVQTQQPRNEA
jgi:hypothetical protein